MGISTDERLPGLESRLASILVHPVCQGLRQIVGQRDCHLVGGALRDIALGREPRDFDVIVAGEGAGVAAQLAHRVGSRSIRLGGNRFAAYRVTREEQPVDIWDRGANSLEADLRRRDFTIHSFALDLHSGALLDPHHGLHDLAKGRLRMTTPASFVEDPLRVLRLCRLQAQLESFRIEPATRDKARDSVTELAGVAKERIRSELDLTLNQKRIVSAVELWIELAIFPESILGLSLSSSQNQRLGLDLPEALQALEDTAGTSRALRDSASARLSLMLILLEKVSTFSRAAAVESLQRMGLLTKARARQIALLVEAGNLPIEESKQRWYLYRLGELWPEALCLSAALASPTHSSKTDSSPLAQAIELATQKGEEDLRSTHPD